MSSLKVDNITGRGSTGFTGSVKSEGGNTTTDLQQGLCKVWYNISSNFATTNDSFNIGSITDRGTGSMYGVFTNNMNSLHYTNPSIVAPAASGSMGTTNSNRCVIASADTTARNSVNAFGTDNLAATDEENLQSIIHGDLA